MQFPVVLSDHKRIVLAPSDWFDGIGRLDIDRGVLDIAIGPLGARSLAWILDREGQYFGLEWQGRLPKSWMHWMTLSRQRERYRIAKPQAVSVGKVLELLEGHSDPFEEAPNTSDLRSALRALPENAILGPDFMRSYLGE